MLYIILASTYPRHASFLPNHPESFARRIPSSFSSSSASRPFRPVPSTLFFFLYRVLRFFAITRSASITLLPTILSAPIAGYRCLHFHFPPVRFIKSALPLSRTRPNKIWPNDPAVTRSVTRHDFHLYSCLIRFINQATFACSPFSDAPFRIDTRNIASSTRLRAKGQPWYTPFSLPHPPCYRFCERHSG